MNTIRGSLGGVPKSNFFSFQDIIMSVTGILIVIALMLALQIDRVTESPDHKQISGDSEPADVNQHDLETLQIKMQEMKEHLELLQSASRKTESESEIKTQIAKLEDQISGMVSRPQSDARTPLDSTPIASVKSKAVEILRLREEIKECEDAILRSSHSAGLASGKMMELEQKVRELEAMIAAARLENKKLRLIRGLSDTTKEPVIIDVGEGRMRIMRFDKPQPIELKSLQDFYVQIKNFRKQDQYFVLYFRPSGAARFEELRQAVKNSGFEVGYDAIDEDAELSLGKEDG
ncbi:MAG: hypothetical protein ABI600_09960 [Luteolibacter sp.]